VIAFSRRLTYEECTHDVLADMAQRHGVDTATLLFYDCVRAAPRNQEIVAALDGGAGPIAPAAIHRGEPACGKILIAPALFYRERPDIGGDGAVVQAAARAAGLDVDVLPVASGGTARQNAAAIRALLPAHCDRPTVLVSLSKGTADVRLAFESMPSLPRALTAWVNVSGLAHGTPAIDTLTSRWWSRWALRALLARHHAPFELMQEFAANGQSALNAPARAPHGLLTINLIACPLSRHLSTRFGRIRHRQMASFGPNDGLTLLRDAIVEPGLVYPVLGADHYFRSADVPRIIARLLAFLDSQGCFSSERM
jgi:hypothetical protein